jgi:hypothetical protein
VCCNRIVWGADQYTVVRVHHTKGAPDRWLEEVAPVLTEYAEGSGKPVAEAIEAARDKSEDDLDRLLATRFGRSMVEPIKAIHLAEEGWPIETTWDVTVAVAAHAPLDPEHRQAFRYRARGRRPAERRLTTADPCMAARYAGDRRRRTTLRQRRVTTDGRQAAVDRRDGRAKLIRVFRVACAKNAGLAYGWCRTVLDGWSAIAGGLLV